ncbi:hypothetical protein CF161_28845 [Pseudomonas sp. CF161]|nr:hypothetical protein CF161_28845 [Pseudomonas sp. CF161]
MFFFEERPLADRRDTDIPTAPANAKNDPALKEVTDRLRRDVTAQVGLFADIVGSQAFGFQLIADGLACNGHEHAQLTRWQVNRSQCLHKAIVHTGKSPRVV